MKEKGITLIVLVITIVVLIILAGVAIAALSGNNGIVKKAQESKQKGEESSDNEVARVSEYETQIGIHTGEGGSSEKINEYGFYYNTQYVCENYNGPYGEVEVSELIENDNDILIGVYEKKARQEHANLSNFYDYAGNLLVNKDKTIFAINDLTYNERYDAVDGFGQDCVIWFDNNGYLHEEYIIPSQNVTVSNKSINIGGMFIATFSEDGKSYEMNGNTFSIK